MPFVYCPKEREIAIKASIVPWIAKVIALQHFRGPCVAVGSKMDNSSQTKIHRCPRWSKSGQTFATQWLSAMCQSRPMHRTKRPFYSITSSAMDSTPAGMVRPSALAVVRLITNSNLVDCSTGRSAGFAPFRMLPV